MDQNMRTEANEVEFSQYILKLGEGREDIIQEINQNSVRIPDKYLVHDINALIERVFPNLEVEDKELSSLIEGTIYAPLNKNIKNLNAICIGRFPGQKKYTYLMTPYCRKIRRMPYQ